MSIVEAITITGAVTGCVLLQRVDDVAVGLVVDVEGGAIQTTRRVLDGGGFAEDA